MGESTPLEQAQESHQSLLDFDNEVLERMVGAAGGADCPVEPLPQQSVVARLPPQPADRAIRGLQFGQSQQPVLQEPGRDSIGCFPLTWSDSGLVVPPDWPQPNCWILPSVGLSVSYNLPDPGGGAGAYQLECGAAAPQLVTEYKCTSVCFSSEWPVPPHPLAFEDPGLVRGEIGSVPQERSHLAKEWQLGARPKELAGPLSEVGGLEKILASSYFCWRAT
uniref:Uncharacterized protein n=1 Tax=Sphaerodactylus townsendi TaxID=933632 RepID=A0ACB8F017_9SAUR